MNYSDFLKQKIKIPNSTGFEVEPENKFLFPFQKEIIKWALRKGRAALFLDTGLGKTLCQLSWAFEVYKKTGKNVLVLAPLAVTSQTQREGRKFGINVNICRCQTDVKNGISITNYDMLEHFNPDEFVGVVLDESSILKSYMGTTKRLIIEKFSRIKYKLSCTATPSPNNHMEILNQAEFMGVMKSHEALAIWFINNAMECGGYMLKGHAVKSFWEWVSTWAVCISRPSDIGYSDEGYILPPLNEVEVIVDVSEVSEDFTNGFFRDVGTSATDFHKEKRSTARVRAQECARIAKSSSEQFMIWCNTDYEAEELKLELPEAVEVRGSHATDYKEAKAMDFIDGKIRVLISKPKIFGYGLNFQNCRNTIFCGLDYSYESYYQAVRRFWRFGQKKQVNSFVVIGSTEKRILEIIKQKEQKQNDMKIGMYNGVKEIQNSNIKGKEFKVNFEAPKIQVPTWLKTEIPPNNNKERVNAA